ncbi:MAG: ankyrin repeat protein 50-like [Paucimonas sp.]|nr:ankyrin repeat protein 50-like [Paucimonas sp.]
MKRAAENPPPFERGSTPASLGAPAPVITGASVPANGSQPIDVKSRGCKEDVRGLAWPEMPDQPRYAVEFGQMQRLKRWVEAGNHPDSVRDRGTSLTARAIAFRRHDMLEYLLAQGASVELADDEGRRPLMRAVADANTGAAKILLAKNADVNARDAKGESALTIAVRHSRPKLVAILLQHGADTSVRVTPGVPVPFFSDASNWLKSGAPAIRGALLITKPVVPPLFLAVAVGKLPIVKMLLENGAAPMLVPEAGHTCAMAAAQYGRCDILQYLLKAGHGKVTEQDGMGRMPVYHALVAGRLDTVKYLVAQGASLDESPPNACAASFAAASGNVPTLRYVLEQRPGQINWVGIDADANANLVAVAAAKGWLEIIRELRDRGLEPAAVANPGCALVAAARCNYLPVVEFLVDSCKVPVDAPGILKTTALHEAASGGHVDIIQYLVRHGADHSLKDEEGRTAAELAQQAGKIEAANFLRGVADGPVGAQAFCRALEAPDLGGSGVAAAYQDIDNELTTTTTASTTTTTTSTAGTSAASLPGAPSPLAPAPWMAPGGDMGLEQANGPPDGGPVLQPRRGSSLRGHGEYSGRPAVNPLLPLARRPGDPGYADFPGAFAPPPPLSGPGMPNPVPGGYGPPGTGLRFAAGVTPLPAQPPENPASVVRIATNAPGAPRQ